MKKDKKNSTSEKHFYLKWWFWTIIIVLFAITWIFLLISDIDLRTSIIGICGIWGSTIATIFIGVIAANQNDKAEIRERKEILIREIKQEQRQFIEDFSKTFDYENFYDLLFAYLSYKDTFEDVQKKGFYTLNLIGKLNQFEKNLEMINYSRICLKPFMEAYTEFKKFVTTKLMKAKQIKIVDEKTEKTYRQYYPKLAKKLNEQLVNMNQLKNAVIFEMQFAINQVVNSKTKKRFLEVEEVILKNVEENIDEKISAVIKVKKKN